MSEPTRFAVQVMATWTTEGDQASSRVYVIAEDQRVSLWLPGQGRMNLSRADAQTIGEVLIEAAVVREKPPAPAAIFGIPVKLGLPPAVVDRKEYTIAAGRFRAEYLEAEAHGSANYGHRTWVEMLGGWGCRDCGARP